MVRYGGGEVSEREITDLAELPETAPGAGVTWIPHKGSATKAASSAPLAAPRVFAA
jgi:hypothetical protein